MKKLDKCQVKGQCEVEGCNNLAKYGLYRTKPNGKKEWLKVCIFHEGQIGDENMRRAGGYYSKGGEK